MAKENPQASEENELEIEAEESEEERSEDSSSEEDESSESETETVIKHTIEEVTSRKRRFEEANEGEWFEKSYLLEGMINCGFVSEDAAKERWRMLPMETRKRMEEKFRDLLDEEMRLARRKAKLLRDIAAALARVVVP